MRLLHYLINHLTDEEQAQLENGQFSGRELLVLNYIRRHQGRELPESPEAAEALGMTVGHIDKVHSVLLRKVYQLLVPAGGAALLTWLCVQKNLYHNFRHELLVQEKQLLKAVGGLVPNAELAAFYLRGLWWLSAHFYRQYEPRLADRFAEAHRAASVDWNPAHEAMVQTRRLFYEVNRRAAHRQTARQQTDLLERLRQWESRLEATDWHTARFFVYRGLGSYFTFVQLDPTRILEYIQKAIQTLDHTPDLIAEFPTIRAGLTLQYGESLYANDRFEDARQAYSPLFNPPSSGLPGLYYHAEKYIELCLIAREFDRARTLIQDVYRLHLTYPLNINSLRGISSSLKLALLTGEPAEIPQLLNVGWTIIDKTTYFPHEMELRSLEAFYFFLYSDPELAHNRARNHLRMLQAQQNEALCGTHIQLMKALADLVDASGPAARRKRAPAERLVATLGSLHKVYALILERCLQQASR